MTGRHFSALVSLFAALALLLWAPLPATAALDALELSLLEERVSSLRWDNIEDDCMMISGPEPRYSPGHGMHLISLNPGDALKVKIPGERVLRLLLPDTGHTLADLEVFLSNGTGLHARRSIPMTPDRRSGLVLPEKGTPGVCRIAFPGRDKENRTAKTQDRREYHGKESGKEQVKVALFLSRRDPPGRLAHYRDLVPLAGEPAAVTDDRDVGKEKFWQVRAFQPTRFQMTGPARVLLENRLVYPEKEQARRVAYFLETRMDEEEEQSVFDFETAPETSKVIRINNSPTVCGRLRTAFLTIPPGDHTVTLTSRADLLLRASALDPEDNDYLFHRINGPENLDKTLDRLISGPVSRTIPGLWQSTPPVIPPLKGTTPQIHGTARLMARDNFRPGSGLGAAALMHRQADKHPGAGQVARAAERIAGAHTFFRDLYPLNTPQTRPLQWRRYLLSRMKQRRESTMVVARQHARKLQEGVKKGLFLDIPGPNTPLVYPLPIQNAPSRLRLMVLPNGETAKEVFLQLDDKQPMVFRVEPRHDLPREQFRITLAEAGAAVASLPRTTSPGHDRPNRNSSRAGRNTGPKQVFIGAMVRPGFFDIPLPPGTSRVKLWHPGERKTGEIPMAALQYLTSRPWRMSETGYLQVAADTGKEQFKEFARLLADGPETPDRFLEKKSGQAPARGIMQRDMVNFQLPTIRMIRSRHAVFTASRSKNVSLSRSAAVGPAERNRLIKKAKALEAGEHLLPALETWAELFYGSSGAVHNKAAARVAEHLINLGETYLAERFLKQQFLGEDPNLSRQAFQGLVQLYEKGRQTEKLLSLYCAMAVLRPVPSTIKALGRQLMQRGDFFHAMVLASTVNSADTRMMRLKAALALGWYQTAHLLTEKLEDPAARRYWQAMALLHQSDVSRALELFNDLAKAPVTKSTANGATSFKARAARLSREIRQGQKIRADLFSRDAGRRLQGADQWQSWYSSLPGPFFWESDTACVTASDGWMPLYSHSRNRYASAACASPEEPVKASFYGPLRLKVSVRRIHARENKVPVDTWFSIEQTHRSDPGSVKAETVPITKDLPVQGLVIPGKSALAPGRQVSFEMNLSRGINDLEISSNSDHLLVSFHISRPGTPVADILPPPAVETFRAIVRGRFTRSDLDVAGMEEIFRPGCRCMFQDCVKLISPGSPPRVMALAGSEKKRSSPSVTATTHAVATRAGMDPATAMTMAEPPSMEKSVFKKMAGLVLEAENNPGMAIQAEAEARRLFSMHPDLPELGSLLHRISAKTTWEAMAMVEADSGLRFFPLESWQPEAPSLRVRKALLPRLDRLEPHDSSPISPGRIAPQARLVTGDDDLVLSMNNPKPVSVEGTVTLMDLPLMEPAPVTIFYQVDDLPRKTATLSSKTPRVSFTCQIPMGNHKITTGFVHRYPNQFLKALFRERPENGGTFQGKCSAPAVKCRKRPAGNTTQTAFTPIRQEPGPRRFFYVATSSEPVRARVKGPAWVRIDRRKDSETVVGYRYIQPGWQQLVLAPGPDETEALFRLHRRVLKHAPDQPQKNRPVTVPYDQLPEPYLQIAPDYPVKEVRFCDAYPLGTQEDGTWSVTGKARRSTAIDDDPPATDQKSEHNPRTVEFSVSHHWHNGRECLDTAVPGSSYFTTTFLERFRDNGGPVAGIEEDFYFYPDRIPLDINLRASLYMQNPEADTFDADSHFSREYSGRFKARFFQKRDVTTKFYHIPSLFLFGRVLSVEDENQYPGDTLDRQIFTSYKGNHRSGMGVSDYAAFSPWLDTLFHVKGEINSNESSNLFDPDNVKLQAGVKQLLGEFQVNLQYRHARYFADQDRENSSTRNLVDLELAWHHWMPDQQRLSMGIDFTGDMDNGDYQALFSLSWFFSRGRGLKDIRPGDLDFYPIHRRNLPREKNNLNLRSPRSLLQRNR